MIQIKNLTKKYGEALILENADFIFPQKGIVCLRGASGGGKTTLFNLLAGFDTDYEGEITVGGTLLRSLNQDALCAYRRDNIGFVFQDYHLLSGYTVLENVMLSSALSQHSREESLQKAKALLLSIGLLEKAEQMVETLSGGQKQRVAIARALMGDPQIIFADEPTGALDRQTSIEIMGLLRKISAEKLVVLITHDAKICAFADETIHIGGKRIIAEQAPPLRAEPLRPLLLREGARPSAFSLGAKNFKVHLGRYLAVSLAISLGLLAFLFSLSFGNVMERSISEFQKKNTAFSSGYIRGADDGTVLSHLNSDDRIENAYYQYTLKNISLSLGDESQLMAEKLPGSKATESLSYGVMPRRGENEIALSPSLAKKFGGDIKDLIGKELTLEHGGQNISLTVSGIFNAGYDDFFVSSDVEQQLYEGIAGEENYSICYEVPDFDNIVPVSNSLELRGIDSKNAASEVYSLQNTFSSLNKLFLVISLLILSIGLFICAVLLVKLQNTRYHEVGLLAALGFGRELISSMISAENILLSSLATAVNLLLLGLCVLASSLLKLPFMLSGLQILLSVAATFAVVILLSAAASFKLLRAEPAQALRR